MVGDDVVGLIDNAIGARARRLLGFVEQYRYRRVCVCRQYPREL